MRLYYADGRQISESDPQVGAVRQLVTDKLLNLGFSRVQVDESGLAVQTTLSKSAMEGARSAVGATKPNVSGLVVATASVEVRSGALLAFSGDSNDARDVGEWALAPAPVGALFKVPALAMALSNGLTLKSTFDGNSPFLLDGLQIRNGVQVAGTPPSGTSYGDRVSLLQGLEESINTVYVAMTTSVKDGPEKVRDMAVAMGVSPNAPGLALTNAAGQRLAPATIALGSASISPIDVANTYATIADSGIKHAWYVVSKVTDSHGRLLWAQGGEGTRAMSPGVATDLTTAMEGVVRRGVGSRASVLGPSTAAMTGVGMSRDGTDVISSWFAGFTPPVATAVLYVRPGTSGKGALPLNGALTPYFGGDYPAETWVALIKAIGAP